MEKLLARLERRFGRYAPEGVILWVVGLSGLLHLLVFARPAAAPLLWLLPDAVLGGEVWRLVTFACAPAGAVSMAGLFWTALGLWFLHTMGSALEAQWGAFRFDLFLFVGWLLTAAAAFAVGPVTGTFIATALLLAFAVEFPEYEVLLIVLPVKVKWLGVFSGGLMLWQLATGGLQTRAAVVAALADFLLFCGPEVARFGRGATRAARSREAPEGFGPIARRPRVCAKCGRSDKDDASLEFRVCDCQEKCHGKLTEYCIDHARAH